MNEQELARKIVQRLNDGLDQIKQGNLYRLQSARQAALDRCGDATAPAFSPVLAGATIRGSHGRHVSARNLIAAGLLLLLSLTGVAYWQFAVQSNDIAEIDASLLTGDLPFNAYLDSNFDAWLKRSSQ